MSEERLWKALGQVDDCWVEEAASAPMEKRGRPIWRWLTAAACLLLVVSAGVGVWQSGLLGDITGSKWPKKEAVPSHTSDEIATIPRWEEMSISQQFGEVIYNGDRYSSRVAEIAANRVGLQLDKGMPEGIDDYTGRVYTAQATIYAIEGLAPECAVALQFEGRTDYFAYVNPYYQPETLGDFLTDLNLQETLSFGSVWYEWLKTDGTFATVEFVDIEDAVIWELLLDDPSSTAVEDFDSRDFAAVMSVSVNIPLLGYQNISMAVTQDGYLTTNILDTGKAFYIGKEKVEGFLAYVLNNGEGYELVPPADASVLTVPE